MALIGAAQQLAEALDDHQDLRLTRRARPWLQLAWLAGWPRNPWESVRFRRAVWPEAVGQHHTEVVKVPEPSAETAALDAEVRRLVYDTFLEEGRAILRSSLAIQLSQSHQTIDNSLQRLSAAHMLVLQPESGEILMANPFSAVPTPFRVESSSRGWWANCIWDALGVSAMANVDAQVRTSCPDCGQALAVEVRDGRLSSGQGIVHFAVPAAHWWDDIVFT